MRNGIAFSVVALMIVNACGGSTSVESESEAQGGSNSTASTSAGGNAGGAGGGSTSSSTTTDSTTSTSGNACEDACQHAADCGFELCDQFGIDCTTDQYDCPAACIANATCEEITTFDSALLTCVNDCQGSGGSGGGGGGAQSECQSCGNACLAEVAACAMDATCQGWALCSSSCTEPSCYDACDAQYPDAAPLFQPIYGCLCTNCASECAESVDPCEE